jgi:succinoglycan biosynthesis protein ExoM
VPPSRATFDWLARRRLRAGQTHGRLLRGRLGLLAAPGQVGLALTKAGYCLAAALPAAASPMRRNCTLLRGIMHLGVVGGLLGLRDAHHYGGPAPQDGPGEIAHIPRLEGPERDRQVGGGGRI